MSRFHFVFILILLQLSNLFSQNIGIGESSFTPEQSSILEIKSDNKGLLIPRLTIEQRDAIDNPAVGLIIFNLDCGNINYYFNNTWVELGSVIIPIPETIIGDFNPCRNQTEVDYVASEVSGATNYIWTVPNDAVVVSNIANQVKINFGIIGGQICVKATNGCGTSNEKCIGVTLKLPPSTPGFIEGLSNPCENITNVQYSVETVENTLEYLWTVPDDAEIVQGQGTNSIFVNFGQSNGYVKVSTINLCGESTPSVKEISLKRIPPQLSAIIGNVNPCLNQPNVMYSISDVSEATSYTWTVPNGATIVSGQNTNSIAVNFGANGGNITVKANNECGSSAEKSLSITLQPAPNSPGNITGKTNPCQNENGVIYSVSGVVGATSYTWTVPNGATIVSGQNTNSIAVNFGANGGNITVKANNECGSSAEKSLSIALKSAPSQPSVISGPNAFLLGQTGVEYSVTNVSGVAYNWSYSGTGETITSGQGTHSISVNYSSIATAGTWILTPSNECGIGVPVTKDITIAVPEIKLGDYYQGGIVFYVEGEIGNQKGLIMALQNVDSCRYATGGTTIGSDSEDDGLFNTNKMIEVQPTTADAALACRNYGGGGYNDWYLPAKNEFQKFLDNSNIVNDSIATNGGILIVLSSGSPSLFYWTSTETAIGTAYCYLTINQSFITYGKPIAGLVRPIRRFEY
jgi:hypothetical protein